MRRSGNLNKAVFLDRDGVINQALIRENMPFSPRNIDELVILNDVSEAVSLLHRYGFVTVVVTNQPDIARGFMTLDTLLKIHDAISATWPGRAIYNDNGRTPPLHVFTSFLFTVLQAVFE